MRYMQLPACPVCTMPSMALARTAGSSDRSLRVALMLPIAVVCSLLECLPLAVISCWALWSTPSSMHAAAD